MKEKILNALKTNFGGVKSEILDRIATKAAKTVKSEEELTTYVEGVTIQTILDAYGDSRATDAQKTAVVNYEKKYGIKDGKPIVDNKKSDVVAAPQVDDDTPEWAKALIASNKALVERVDKMDGENIAKSRHAQLDEILADMPDSVKTQYTKNFCRMTFKDDTDFSSWLEESKTDIEGMKADFKAKGGIVTPPKVSGGTGRSEVNPALKAQLEAQKTAPAAPTTGMNATILGLPTVTPNAN